MIFGSLKAQITLKQIEPYKPGGVRTDSALVITGTDGVLRFTPFDSIFQNFMIDCDKVENCLDSGAFFCDKVLECLDDGALCEALNNFGSQNVQSTGNFVWINSSGECKRGPISSLPGFGFNCDSVLNCLDAGILCEALNNLDEDTITIDSKVLFFDGEGNCYRGNISDIPGVGFNCDSVLLCLNDGVLCDAIGNFDMGVPEDGDYVPVWNADGCKLVSLDSLGGGMDSLNCAAVLDCLNDGALCDALKAFDESMTTDPDYVFGELNNECIKINWDSLMGDCQFELEVGEFGFNPDGCNWATTCDGGDTYSNQFYASLVATPLNSGGYTIDLYGHSEPANECVMSSIEIEIPPAGIDSIYTDIDCTPSIGYFKNGNGPYQVALPVYDLTSSVSSGIVTINLRVNGTICDTETFCVCDGTAGCSGGSATCGIPLTESDEIESKPVQGIRFNAYDLPQFVSHKAARRSCELNPGEMYILKRSNKIYFKK